MMKPHLTPTRIVDKNGKATTVHKKTSPAASSKLINANPAPSPNAAVSSPADLASYLYDDKGPIVLDRVITVIEKMNDYDPEFVSFIFQLVSEGSDASQKAAFNSAKTELTKEASIFYGAPNIDRRKVRDFRSRVARDWNIANVMEELGNSEQLIDIQLKVITVNRHLLDSGGYFLPGEHEDAPYWRGVTALVLVDEDNYGMRTINTDVVPFIGWAGKHDDIGTIIEVARERGTLNVSTIQGIMATRDSTATALREGSL